MAVGLIIVSGIAAAIIAFFMFHKLRRNWLRVFAVIVCLVLPILLYSVWFTLLPADEDGNFWGWWMTGLVMMSPVLVSWVVGVFVGIFTQRVSAR
jgi:hypothetical protein